MLVLYTTLYSWERLETNGVDQRADAQRGALPAAGTLDTPEYGWRNWFSTTYRCTTSNKECVCQTDPPVYNNYWLCDNYYVSKLVYCYTMHNFPCFALAWTKAKSVLESKMMELASTAWPLKLSCPVPALTVTLVFVGSKLCINSGFWEYNHWRSVERYNHVPWGRILCSFTDLYIYTIFIKNPILSLLFSRFVLFVKKRINSRY